MVLKNKSTRDGFVSPSGNITRPEQKYFPLFPSKSCNNCIVFSVGNLNVELMKHSTYGGRVKLFVGNRGPGLVNVSPGRVQEKWPVDNSALFSVAYSQVSEVEAKLISLSHPFHSFSILVYLIRNPVHYT